MKAIKIMTIVLGACLSCSCESNTYDDISAITTDPTYLENVKPIMSANCTSCHSTDGGQDPYLETYDQVKTAVLENNLLEQISAPSGQGMPEDQRMSQTKINTVSTWATNGFPN